MSGRKIVPAAIFLSIADTLRTIVFAERKEEYHGQLHNPAAFLVRCINDAAKNGKIKVIAVDIPTGVNTDTGEISGNGEEHTGEPIYADMKRLISP